MNHSDRKLFNQALQLKDEGRYGEALQIFRDISERNPGSAAPFGLMAMICNVTRRDSEAARYASKAVELSPKSELATRSLFNALISLRRFAEAYDVVKSFKKRTGSNAFDDLIGHLEDPEDYEDLEKSLDEVDGDRGE